MKNNAEELKLPGFKTYYRGIVIKTVWCWQSERHIN